MDRLKASVNQIGIAEPLKVAEKPGGGYVVIDGTMRLNAVIAIRASDPSRFSTVPAYLLDYNRRYEIRFQSDIYQDLLPSQLARLVEHLHQAEHVRKLDIAKYIGISPATLRNYTGLQRLVERKGLSAKVVDLMDVSVLPASNPYAWLRLTDAGVERVITERFAMGAAAPEIWVADTIDAARRGQAERYPLKYVETVTAELPPEYYHSGEATRAIKRDLGMRRAGGQKQTQAARDARSRLSQVALKSNEPVIITAAKAFDDYLARVK